jgi:lipopolysaccharide export system permease protein
LILERHIIRDILSPQMAIGLVLIIIFSGYSATRFLNDAVNGLLAGQTVAALVFFKVLIALEVLLPVTLYLAIVLALSQLHADNEMTAMEGCGIGPGRVVKSVVFLALPLALLVSGLSLYARPWAYAQIYASEAGAKEDFNFAKVEAGRFYELGDNLVFFAEKIDSDKNLAHKVYIWELKADGRRVTFAETAQQLDNPKGKPESIVFQNGQHYLLATNSQRVSRVAFDRNSLQLTSRVAPRQYKRKAAPTAQLAASKNPEELAEYQWRLTTGPSTVLLALLAIPLSRSAPRSSRYSKATGAIVLFFVYYNLSLMVKTWVERQVLSPSPGVWWVNLLFGPPILALVFLPWLKALGRKNGAQNLREPGR